MSKQMPTEAWEDDRFGSFDITCVIGTVEYERNGDGRPAHVAAFEMVAMHDTPGRFSWPMPHGGTCHVTVEHEMPTDGAA